MVNPELEPLVIPLTVVIILVLFTVSARHRQGRSTLRPDHGTVVRLHRCRWGVGIAPILASCGPCHRRTRSASSLLIQLRGSSPWLRWCSPSPARRLCTPISVTSAGDRLPSAWLAAGLPACTLSYLGQGASILADPAAIRAPFFLLAPSWAQLPMVLLATAATVIASQAVITGAFSVARQAVQLGYLPRLRILHTSQQTIGQIYVPYINWALMIAVIALVLGFQSSAALAYAFGMAVTGTIIITTLLLFYLARREWRWPWWLVVVVAGPILLLEALFLAANLTKLVHGAWLPLLIAVAIFTVLTTWQRGRAIVTAQREAAEGPLAEFVERLHDAEFPVQRVPGTAVFLNRGRTTVPLALRANVEHNHVLHEHVLIVAVETVPVPTVQSADVAVVDALKHRDDGIAHVTIPVGYMESADVPAVLDALPADRFESAIDIEHASYFLSTIDLGLADG